jgi:SAM-dependent methyltransferase
MPSEATIDLMGCKDLEAEQILGWTDRFTDIIKPRLLAFRSGATLAAEEVSELKAFGLVGEATGELSALAKPLADLFASEGWQDTDEFEAAVKDFLPERAEGSVLEVGCSTGRKLRTLGASFTTRRVGVDLDSRALALGFRLARRENQQVDFICCSAYSLPFPSQSFDFVICRNALTYMHHRTALREMSRVLKPNGLLYLRFENIWFDLACLSRPRRLRSFVLLARNFVLGAALALFGCQPIPGGSLRGWRAFATLRRLKKMLQAGNCAVVHVATAQNCPRFLSFPTQTSLVARKVK